MARQPMVTRTITTTKVSVLCLDVVTQETVTKEITVPRVFKDEAKLLTKVKPLVETDTIKAVHITGAEVVETLYGMPEHEFIAHAEVLPPRPAPKAKDETQMSMDE